jgi:hypothetical protein
VETFPTAAVATPEVGGTSLRWYRGGERSMNIRAAKRFSRDPGDAISAT